MKKFVQKIPNVGYQDGGDDVARVRGRSHIGRAVRFVDFIARFSTDIVYFSYRSSHLSLPIFVTDKSCL